MATVNRNEFAEIVGKSAKWVGKWIDEGLPAEGGGRGKPVAIDTVLALQWLIDREVRKQVGDDPDEDSIPRAGTKDGEELLLTKAKRRKADVEADKAEETVIALSDVGQFLFSISTLFGNELNGLGTRLGPEVAPLSDAAICKSLIDKECRHVREVTAERLNQFVSEYRAASGRDGEGAATEECGGLGDS